MQRLLLLLFFIIIKSSFSQKSRIEISGIISDESGKVINAHIINKSSKKGTFSNDKGFFHIKVHLGEELKITSIQHHLQTIIITNDIIKTKRLNLYLNLKDYTLEEIQLKKHLLYGILEKDLQLVPKDIIPLKSKKALDFSMIKLKNKILVANPVEGTITIKIPVFTIQKEKRLTERVAKEKFEDQFVNKIINLIGKHTFIKNYKIPSDKIHHFINSNREQKLTTFVKNEETFKLIEFLQKKSILYLKEINKTNKNP